MAASLPTELIGRVSKRIGWYVNHENLLVRFVSLWIVVASAFTAAWLLSYFFLPQGLLRGGNPGASTGYAGSITREFLWLFGWNVGVSLIAIGANTLRSVNTPMGYVIEVVQAPWYGAVWGTGSLAIGTGARIVPSPTVLVERSGPMEITAIVAIVVATRGVMIWRQESGPRWREEFDRVQSPSDWSLTRREWALLIGGYLLLAVACYREAVAIAQIAG
ncbi:hypothetical protein [Haloplanus aerogenes]|uniref:Uncharacterized protein n=1 Tax=Haloplanus aerogenes TaxID=660522 RepID=A0A3M0CF21_9EURY|nr:hypothetical protein [Haloplanus aerogenes]AZH26037.1 hypothetical protein DU502_12000 [Haloplanus aerogenes]RMB08231.1 hypothetical protein ATH50_3644 [Haloplanus aerogenes]